MEFCNLYPGSFGSNCYCLFSGTDAAVIDPSANAREILDEISQRGATLRMILLTHGHFDHLFSLDDLRKKSGAPVYLHASDADLPGDARKNAFRLFFGRERTWMPPDQLLADGETLLLGDEQLQVLHTPGHTEGSVCFLCGDTLFSGDTLFCDNVGRCDLPGGDEEALYRSLSSLSALPHGLVLCPGHGPASTLGAALARTLP